MGSFHWSRYDRRPGHQRTPRVPHLFKRVPEEEGGSRMVIVEQVSVITHFRSAICIGDSVPCILYPAQVAYSPRIRYLHRLLSPAECEHILKISQPLFSRSPVRASAKSSQVKSSHVKSSQVKSSQVNLVP